MCFQNWPGQEWQNACRQLHLNNAGIAISPQIPSQFLTSDHALAHLNTLVEVRHKLSHTFHE